MKVIFCVKIVVSSAEGFIPVLFFFFSASSKKKFNKNVKKPLSPYDFGISIGKDQAACAICKNYVLKKSISIKGAKFIKAD